MTSMERNKERRQRRLFAAIAGWALLGAASTGIVACSNADAAETADSSVVAASASSSSAAVGTTSSAATPSSAAVASAAPTTEAVTTAAPTTEATATTAATGSYTDGSYTATGSYASPGGEESITVTLTLAGDVITDATAEGDATRPPSSQYQEQFADNFAALIVGKDIDDVSLDKVAGSSLTSGGFNAAVESIKSDALA